MNLVVPGPWRARVRFSAEEERSALRRTSGAEISRSTLRRVDARNPLIDVLVPDAQLEKLQAAHPVQVLDDIGRMTAEATRRVSKVNRYRKD